MHALVYPTTTPHHTPGERSYHIFYCLLKGHPGVRSPLSPPHTLRTPLAPAHTPRLYTLSAPTYHTPHALT